MDLIRKTKKFIKSRSKIIAIEHVVSEKENMLGKVALITGGSGGIGLAIAKRLLESGCKIIIAGTNIKKLEDLVDSLNGNESTKWMVIDYSKTDSISDSLKKATQIFGKIDIFISSVGVHTANVDFWNMNPEEYDRVMDINLKGTFFACQEIGRYMRDNEIHGNIVLISSSRGSEPAWSPYGLSKWGLRGLTLGLAEIFQPYGINVNAIAPGSTATSLIGIKEGDNIYSDENGAHRLIMPDEVASLVKTIVSESGRMITGETIHISAGRGLFDIR